jgi:hypothetical protein
MLAVQRAATDEDVTAAVTALKASVPALFTATSGGTPTGDPGRPPTGPGNPPAGTGQWGTSGREEAARRYSRQSGQQGQTA